MAGEDKKASRHFYFKADGQKSRHKAKYYERHKRSLIFLRRKQKVVCLLIKTDLC